MIKVVHIASLAELSRVVKNKFSVYPAALKPVEIVARTPGTGIQVLWFAAKRFQHTEVGNKFCKQEHMPNSDPNCRSTTVSLFLRIRFYVKFESSFRGLKQRSSSALFLCN